VEQSIRHQIDAAKWNAKIKKINGLRDWIKVKLEDIEKIIDSEVEST
jgi:hypothetical protein